MPSKSKSKHVPEYIALGGHSDAYKCSCGWQSNGYWDLIEGAWDEWLVHAFDTGTKIEDKDKKRQQWMIKERDAVAQRILSREIAAGFVGKEARGKVGRKR